MSTLTIEFERLHPAAEVPSAVREELRVAGMHVGTFVVGSLRADPSQAYLFWNCKGDIPVLITSRASAFLDVGLAREVVRHFVSAWVCRGGPRQKAA